MRRGGRCVAASPPSRSAPRRGFDASRPRGSPLRRRADITRDPAFRAQFHAMCAAAGVDPLASNKGFWAEMLGFGDFYYELGVQIGARCPRPGSRSAAAHRFLLTPLRRS